MIRQTKIVCTLGPATFSKDAIEKLALNGMTVARINMSHGSKEQYQELIQIIRDINATRTIPIGIMLDTKGPEIRTGDRETPLEIQAGDTVRFCLPGTLSTYSNEEKCIEVSYDAFTQDVQETNQILLDNGEMTFSIDSIETDGSVLSTAKQSGSIGSRRHVNLFGALVDLPTITDKDWEDIRFAASQPVDFVALSFIRNAEDVVRIKDFLQEQGSQAKVIAKIETKQAIDNIVEIVNASDAIMYARGDLGAEIPYELLPSIQTRVVGLCLNNKKPVIIATQMLESMIKHPMPTRAEITDVAYAALIQADSTMLSGESAVGAHPDKAVQAMSKILVESETNLLHSQRIHNSIYEHDRLDSMASELLKEAYRQKVDCLVLCTSNYKKVLAIATQRPSIPVIHIAMPNVLQGALSLSYGVHSLALPDANAQTLSPVLHELLSIADDVTILKIDWESEIPAHGALTL